MDIEDQYIVTIKELLDRADKLDDLLFRIKLEELVKKGGKETERFITHTMTSSSTSKKIRLNLIRIAGYIQRSTFLVALRKIVDLESDIELRQAAIISISKFNDIRALEMLNRVLEMIDDPDLQETVSTEIGRIRLNNPMVTWLPLFLRGSKNSQQFNTTLKVLKKILSPEDVKAFIPYLTHEDTTIEAGVFEIICYRGDETVRFFALEYFKRMCDSLEWSSKEDQKPCLDLLRSLNAYIQRFPHMVVSFASDLEELCRKVTSNRLQRVINRILKVKP